MTEIASFFTSHIFSKEKTKIKHFPLAKNEKIVGVRIEIFGETVFSILDLSIEQAEALKNELEVFLISIGRGGEKEGEERYDYV